jgi:hypothetical protein
MDALPMWGRIRSFSPMTRDVAHSLVLSSLVILLLALFSPVPTFARG